MTEFIKTINLLDDNGFYKIADKMQNSLIKLSAFPYNISALDELPIHQRNVLWERIKEELMQSEDLIFKVKKQRLPEYKSLNLDKSDTGSLENQMHGEDSIPGPAVVVPESSSRYPSMTGDLNNFTWEESHESNTGPDYWKNLLPRR